MYTQHRTTAPSDQDLTAMIRLALWVAIPAALLATLALAVGYTVALGQPLGASTESAVHAGLSWKAPLLTVLLAGWVLVVVRRRGDRVPHDQLRRTVLAGLGLGYLLTPGAWVGRGYLAQWWWPESPGLHTFLIDALVWMAVGGAVLWLATRVREGRHL